MLRALVSKVYPYRHPSGEFELVIASIPYDSTQVEKRALLNVLKTFQGKQTCLVCEPLAAAFGLDRDIGLQDGKLIVDIGGGITEMAIVSLSGIVACHSLPVAGDTFDEEIQGYFRRKYNMSIGVKTAEQIKLQVGAVKEDIVFVPPPYPVLGKDLQSGIPVQQMIRYQEVVEILDKSILKIEQCILRTLEQCPLNYPLISISIALC
jgi:rod shape-determining protein MreB